MAIEVSIFFEAWQVLPEQPDDVFGLVLVFLEVLHLKDIIKIDPQALLLRLRSRKAPNNPLQALLLLIEWI